MLITINSTVVSSACGNLAEWADECFCNINILDMEDGVLTFQLFNIYP